MVPSSYPFPTYSGLLEPKHYKQIGSALWLFLWCISSTTKDVVRDGETWGIVLGNKPVKVSELEERFGVTDKTVRSWIKALESHGYIKVTRAPYGLIFTVRNSKKFITGSVENDRSGSVENYRSQEGERKKTTDLPEENYRSNKDITEINNVVVINDPEIVYRLSKEVESHFVNRRGKGLMISPADFEEIKQMVSDGIPVPLIKESIDTSFAEYKPQHARDEIRSITYCVPRCYNEWMKMKPLPAITEPVLSEPVALGRKGSGAVPHVPAIQNKNKQQLDDLQRIIEEEERHDQR